MLITKHKDWKRHISEDLQEMKFFRVYLPWKSQILNHLDRHEWEEDLVGVTLYDYARLQV
jgi:hypothetical protein